MSIRLIPEILLPRTRAADLLPLNTMATYAQNVTLSECTLKKGDAFSEPHSAYMLPILLTGNNMENKANYVLLLSIPLSESDAETPSQHSYALSVELRSACSFRSVGSFCTLSVGDRNTI